MESQSLNLTGPKLVRALNEEPSLVLSFYSYGVMLRKRINNKVSEYPVDPAHIVLALSAKVVFDTGLISRQTILVRQVGAATTLVEYRAPEITGLFLEGSETPLRIPLPGLVLVRRSDGSNGGTRYALFAVKKRPETLEIPLFHPPLPNVYQHGDICWGSVKRAPKANTIQANSLQSDWTAFLGSPFGNHAVEGKSKSQKRDIRALLTYLDAEGAKTYPKSDLIPTKQTLGNIVEEISQ